MKRRIFLGIDTSNYTTSVGIVGADGELIANIKRALPVKAGERGLRQSDAVFAHIKNLPDAMKEASEHLSNAEILAVGVSEKPRNVKNSYMPCFLSGVALAEGISAAVSAPLFRFSHQCGHIMAALYSSGKLDLIERGFPAFHVSGGTTELLSVTQDTLGFSAKLVGGTSDLNAGQVIDRVGVYMGLPFPSGAELERLAATCSKKPPKRKPSVNGMFASLSGLENLAVALYGESCDRALVAAFVFRYIGESIVQMSEAYAREYGETPFVYAGGVMSNSIIKEMLSARFEAYFAEPALSSDNAVGIAALARQAYNKQIDRDR